MCSKGKWHRLRIKTRSSKDECSTGFQQSSGVYLQIFLDHRSLSTIDQNILMTPPTPPPRFSVLLLICLLVIPPLSFSVFCQFFLIIIDVFLSYFFLSVCLFFFCSVCPFCLAVILSFCLSVFLFFIWSS